MDGTLIDSREGITNGMRYALEGHGLELPEDLSLLIGPTLHQCFNEVFGFHGDELTKAVEKYREYYKEKGLYENTVYPGVMDVLETLKSAGVKLALGTSKVEVYTKVIVKDLKFTPYFDFVCGSLLSGERGKKYDIITHIRNVLDKEGKLRTVMIGDRKFDIAGANKAGINSIGVTWGFSGKDELTQAGATLIVDSMEELLAHCLENAD